MTNEELAKYITRQAGEAMGKELKRCRNFPEIDSKENARIVAAGDAETLHILNIYRPLHPSTKVESPKLLADLICSTVAIRLTTARLTREPVAQFMDQASATVGDMLQDYAERIRAAALEEVASGGQAANDLLAEVLK